jgi:hypothetical protein
VFVHKDSGIATDPVLLVEQVAAWARPPLGTTDRDLAARPSKSRPRPGHPGAAGIVYVGTNTMPILRHGLHHQQGRHEFTMAFVEVPNLRVVAVSQTYMHLGPYGAGAKVRYSSGSYSSELTVDDNGLIVDYPTMAHRIVHHDDIDPSDRAGGPGRLGWDLSLHRERSGGLARTLLRRCRSARSHLHVSRSGFRLVDAGRLPALGRQSLRPRQPR